MRLSLRTAGQKHSPHSRIRISTICTHAIHHRSRSSPVSSPSNRQPARRASFSFISRRSKSASIVLVVASMKVASCPRQSLSRPILVLAHSEVRPSSDHHRLVTPGARGEMVPAVREPFVPHHLRLHAASASHRAEAVVQPQPRTQLHQHTRAARTQPRTHAHRPQCNLSARARRHCTDTHDVHAHAH